MNRHLMYLPLELELLQLIQISLLLMRLMDGNAAHWFKIQVEAVAEESAV